jgi:very-short-patch-repair endonuclease
MKPDDSTLVAIMNNRWDLEIARERQWYRIPVDSVEKLLKKRWPPQWLAFYQTKVFGQEAYRVNYYARIENISKVFRWELFPELPRDAKSEQRYCKLELSSLQRLKKPILSRRWRRIVFIPTTFKKLQSATEINDLYDESPLEDRLWTEFKQLQIDAERQELVKIKNTNYMLDFSIYCTFGKINVEADGDSWHSTRERICEDNKRDNALETEGWRTLRFNTQQVQEEMTSYCVPTIAENINRLGGLKATGTEIPRRINLPQRERFEQLSLF